MMAAGGGRFVAALAALAALTCGTRAPPPPARPVPVRELTLPSGLRVVIEPDEISGIAGLVLTVDVGSVDDPPGKHGMAHTLEHLAFRAPDAGGRSMRARLSRLGAASFNGATGIERTTYWAFGPRAALDDMLGIIAWRLADPLSGVDDQLLPKEASVVAQEVRHREGSAGLEALMPVLLPPGHPHARAWNERRETPTLSLAELRAFAAQFYRPERMTLVIAGPTPPDLPRYLATKLPAAWIGHPAEPHAPVRRPFSHDDLGSGSPDLPTRKTLAVLGPELWIGWRAPPSNGEAAGRLALAARVVDRMLARRLDAGGANDVVDADARDLSGRLASAVVCRLRLRSADDAARVRDETLRAIETLADGFRPQPAVLETILRTRLGLESLKQRARVQAAISHLDAGVETTRMVAIVGATSSGEIAAFARQYLTAARARAVLLLPEERGDDTGREREADTEPEADATADTEPEATTAPAGSAAPPDPALQAIVQAPGARAALVRRLPSGLSVIALRRPGASVVSMLLGFHADPQPGDAPGARIAVGRGLDARPPDAALAGGVLWATRQRDDSLQESLTTFPGRLEQALELLAGDAGSPRVPWPNPAFERWLEREAMRAAAPTHQAARAFRAALFAGHAYQLQPTADAARAVTEREAQAWLARVRRPANGVLVIVGDIDPERAVQAAGRLLRGWTGDVTAPPAPPSALSPDDRAAGARGGMQILRTDDRRRKSSTLRFGCIVPPVRAPRDRIVHQMLAGIIKANVLTRLRLGKGVTYGYDVDAESFRGGTAIIQGHVDVDGAATADALDVLRDWFDPARASPITAKRFEQQRWNRARRSALLNATGQQLGRSLFEAWNMGWEPAVLDDYPRDLASVAIEDVNAALAGCRKSAVISVLGPGGQ